MSEAITEYETVAERVVGRGGGVGRAVDRDAGRPRPQ